MKWQLLLFATLCCECVSAQFSFSDQSPWLFNAATRSGAPIGVSDMNGDGLDDIIRLDQTQTLRIDYQAPGGFTGFTYGQLLGTQWSLCIADVDRNGYNDIFSGGAYNGLKLLKANGTGSNYSLTTISAFPIFLQGSNFADINNDGLIDLFACHDDGISQAYRNTGNGNYVADTSLIYPKSTVPSDNSGNYGSIWMDYNNDGHLDLYISKCRLGVTNPMDGRRLNLLFKNDGFGNFTEVALQAGLRPLAQSWAADFADIDNDGDLDCFLITHDGVSKLYSNNNFGTFTEITAQSGMAPDLAAAGAGLQVKFEDFDNDGFVDLFLTSLGNNHCLFHNNGDYTFTNQATAFPTFQRIHSAATGDLDNDGYMDVIAGFGSGYNASGNTPDILFINNNTSNNYFKVRLHGVSSNINGIGARLEVYGPWGKQIREVRSGESYGIQTSMTKHFGLGQAGFMDSLVVRWPSGVVDKVVNPAINSTLVVEEGSFCSPSLDFQTLVSENEVTFADESTIGATQWAWDFGDGTTSNLANPVHEYAEPGLYFVCLQLNGLCGSGQVCKTINVNCQPLLADFSEQADGLTIAFDDQTFGSPSEWQWDFGDGTTSTEQNPQHTFSAPGAYQVCFIAGNNCGSSQICQTIIVACNSIEAGFAYTADELSVAFSSSANFIASAYYWTFGDDSTSVEQNPTHVFALPGTYTVCLLADGPCGSVTVCQEFAVTCAAPQATFTSATQGIGLTHIFSTQVTGEVNTYNWTFGDGGTSTQASPEHAYLGPGSYLVCLTVGGICGNSQTCQTLTVSCPPPQADFAFTLNELNVSFEDQSQNNPTQWEWTFGDGGTSDLQNPQYSFLFPGTYQVCLNAMGVCGASLVCETVTVNCSAPQAAFSQTINQLTVTFQNESANGATQWSWDFGDGNTSNDQNPQHTYAQPGTYQVCLDAINLCGLTQSCVSVTLTCAAPLVDFAFQQTGLQLSFLDQTANQPVQWQWTFGDGGSASQQNPQHTFAAPGTYEVCLTATSLCGTSQHCEQVIISCAAPVAGFSIQQTGLQVNFSDQSSNQPTQWSWTFGDGATSTQQFPAHTYALPGTYQVCLTTTSLCGTSQECEQLTVTCAAPVTDFSFQQTGLQYSFSDQSANQPTQWLWTFGDGGTSTVQNPQHTYTLPGTYQVCLTATSICGTTQQCEQLTVSCAAPQANFNFQPNGLQYSFQDQSSNQPTQWLWTFGDGATSTQQFPAHTYALPGNYQVCLTAVSLCGSTQTCQVLTVTCTPPQSAFQVTANALQVSFLDATTNQPTQWAWTFGDGATSTQQFPAHTYALPGTYQVCLTTTSICGSSQTCQNITVACAAPDAGFSFQSNELEVQFQDVSSNDPLIWQWTFGDGGTASSQNPLHTYAAPGTYQVCLTATSLCGSDQSCTVVTISCIAPQADFEFNPNGLEINFFDVSLNEPDTWTWDFGDGTSSTEQNPQHNYALANSYVVCLTVSSACGNTQRCELITVNCNAPSPGFSFAINGLTVAFNDVSNGDPTDWTWDFGDGDMSNEQNPQHIYDAPGTYEVCLKAANDCGSLQHCSTITISCAGPEAAFSVSDLTVFTRLFLDASVNSPTSWFWDFGDGGTSTDQNPVYTYSILGTFEVCLIASNACGSDTLCQLIVDTENPVKESPALSVYPNPVSEVLQVNGRHFGAGLVEISLTDVAGRVVRRIPLNGQSGDFQERIEVSALPAGVYWLSCRSAETLLVRRFVKQE